MPNSMKRTLSIIAAFLLTFHTILGQDFTEAATVLDPLASYENVEWVDLDGDKDFDAVAATRVEKATIFKNDSGILTNMGDALEGQPLNYDDHRLFVDFDNNGYIDILLSGTGKVDVLLNQGDFTFVLQETGIHYISARTTPLHCLDIDSDADMDIIIDGKIFLNTDGTFAESIVGLPENVQNYLWGDLNNDGTCICRKRLIRRFFIRTFLKRRVSSAFLKHTHSRSEAKSLMATLIGMAWSTSWHTAITTAPTAWLLS